MSNNTKSNQKGFTIVELLIVIVVIAILAAISIVAYNGIQKRGKTTSAQSAAAQVSKKAASYQAIKNTYPTAAQFATEEESKLEGVSIGTPTEANGTTTVGYAQCTTTGARITFWNYNTGVLTTDTSDPKSIIIGTC